MSDTTPANQPQGSHQHLRLLARGALDWNQERHRDPFTPDLRGFDINAELGQEYDDLEGVDLRQVNMKDALLQGASFQSCILDGSDFRSADLTGVDMHGAKLQGASLQRCILDGSDFRSADLTGSDLTYASIVGANFDGAILKGAKMAHAKCMRSRFSYGVLRDAFLFDKQEPMLPPEFGSISNEITGIQDLLTELKTRRERILRRLHYTKLGPPRIFYRGHAVQGWELTPTVLRTPGHHGADVESQMLTEFISNNPNEFGTNMSLLSQLVKAREYGLPTRLLDISSDPLVALFFAVANDKHDQCDASLHLFGVPPWIVRPFNSDSVAIICAYARLRDSDQRLLVGDVDSKKLVDEYSDFLSGHPRFRWNEAMDRIVGEITKEGRSFSERIDPYDFFRVFVVVPKVDERRLRTQSGAFLLSAFHESFEPERVLERMPNVPLYDHYELTIKAATKPAIREELERLNITRESLLSSLEVSAEAIRERYGFE